MQLKSQSELWLKRILMAQASGEAQAMHHQAVNRYRNISLLGDVSRDESAAEPDEEVART